MLSLLVPDHKTTQLERGFLIADFLFTSFSTVYSVQCGGTTAAAPPPFRPSDPALCGSHPLVTPY